MLELVWNSRRSRGRLYFIYSDSDSRKNCGLRPTPDPASTPTLAETAYFDRLWIQPPLPLVVTVACVFVFLILKSKRDMKITRYMHKTRLMLGILFRITFDGWHWHAVVRILPHWQKVVAPPLLTVHTIFKKALHCSRPFPHGTHFWTCSIQCDVLPRPSLAHMFLWISTDGALDGTFQLIDVLGCFSRHQLLRSVLGSGVFLILTRHRLGYWRTLEWLGGGGRITPPCYLANHWS